MNRAVPGLDQEGFTTIADLRELARRPEHFLRALSAPALVVELAPAPAGALGEPEPEPAGEATRERATRRTIFVDYSARASTAEGARYAGRVAFLTKRPGNPFPEMVSVGRASNNDIVLALSSVSKLHGYFLREGERWAYSDHRSTNGTTINGVRLEPGQRRALEDGDTIRVGTDLTLTFLSPTRLLERSRA